MFGCVRFRLQHGCSKSQLCLLGGGIRYDPPRQGLPSYTFVYHTPSSTILTIRQRLSAGSYTTETSLSSLNSFMIRAHIFPMYDLPVMWSHSLYSFLQIEHSLRSTIMPGLNKAHLRREQKLLHGMQTFYVAAETLCYVVCPHRRTRSILRADQLFPC